MRIDFNEDKHEYSVGGVVIPSVSEILAPLSADRYSQIDKFVLKNAAERGTAVHAATRAIDYGFAPEEDFSISAYLKAYYMFLREVKPEWEMIEQIVWYCRYLGDTPLYAGTVDRYGKIDGKPCVVDIKTYASLSTDAFIGASCQTILYRDAIEAMKDMDGTPEMVKSVWRENDEWMDKEDVIRRYVLHLKSDGNYRFASLDNFDKEREFRSGSVAWSLVNLKYDIQSAYRKKGKK